MTLPDLNPFDLQPRTRLVFGPGTMSRVGEIAAGLGGRRVLLVTDRGIVAAGHAAHVEASLRSAGLSVTVYDAVHENPTTADVDQCLAVARGAEVDLLVGLGGGSSMDTAKGTNFLLTNGGRMQDYWGVGKAARPMLPLVAVPTTAGTGSECQSAALIADEVTHQKMACLDPKAAARVAILDPELTVSKPVRVTAVTGVDALGHALETAVTRTRTAYSWLCSREAFRLAVSAFARVLENPGDVAARGRMQLGAALAGTAIENSMLGAAHSAANPLTARFNVVHGAAVGLMLPAVIRFNAGWDGPRAAYAQLAVEAGLAGSHLREELAVGALLDQLEFLLGKAGMPRTLAEAGVDVEAIPVLAEEAARQWTAGHNPRPVSIHDFVELYRAVAG